MPKAFNIRIYGLLINERNEVLIADERYGDRSFTKFPGGGLEWGEGTVDCLKREFLEELGVAVEIGELFYLTDFFQQSAFHEGHQLISIYYSVSCSEEVLCAIESKDERCEGLRWIPCAEISEKDVTFPVDKIVAEKIRETSGNAATPYKEIPRYPGKENVEK